MNRPSTRTGILIFAMAAIGVALFMSNQGCISNQIATKQDLQRRVRHAIEQTTDENDFEAILNDDYPPNLYPIVLDVDGKMWINGNAPWLKSMGLGPSLLDTPGDQRPPMQTMIQRAKTGGGFEQFQWAHADRLESHVAYVQMLPNTDFIIGMVARKQY